MRGKIIVLNFWSAECPWSERVDKELNNLQEGWGDTVVIWPLASNANETQEEQQKAAKNRCIDLVLRDADQKVAYLYGAETTPHIFLVDKVGILRYQGAYDDTTFRQPQPTVNYLALAVEALLEGSDPNLAQTEPYGCTIDYYPEE
jgi:thioredoxin-related protein